MQNQNTIYGHPYWAFMKLNMLGHCSLTQLLILPDESHGYPAREAVMRMLWEMVNWLDIDVKKEVKE